jgi:hypothetical protein
MKTLITLIAIALLTFGYQKENDVEQVQEKTYQLMGQSYDYLDMAILLNEKYTLYKAYLTPTSGVEFEFHTSEKQIIYFIFNPLSSTFSQVDSIKAESFMYYGNETDQQLSSFSQINMPNYYSLDCSSIGCVWSNGTSSLLMTHNTAEQYYGVTKYLK